MAIVRWEPFRDLVTVQDRMNRIFEEAFRGAARPGTEEDWALGGAWRPPSTSTSTRQHRPEAELPGIDPKDVQVGVENNVLTVRGERKFDSEVKREQYHRVERAYGTFTRSFTLPNVVDTDKIKAEYKDGVLRVTLPTREEAKPKQISIAVTK